MTYISYKWVYYESPTGKGYVDFSPKNKSYVKNDTFLHFAVYIFCGLVTRVLFTKSFSREFRSPRTVRTVRIPDVRVYLFQGGWHGLD